jgi:hypothetical protein
MESESSVSHKLHVTGGQQGLAHFAERPKGQGSPVQGPLAHTGRRTHCALRQPPLTFGPAWFWFHLHLHLHLHLPRARLPVLDKEGNMGALLSSPEGAAPALATDSHLRPAHDEPQPCQAPAADHDADDMDPDERAYHERFMREAINMVSRPPRQPGLPVVCGAG